MTTQGALAATRSPCMVSIDAGHISVRVRSFGGRVRKNLKTASSDATQDEHPELLRRGLDVRNPVLVLGPAQRPNRRATTLMVMAITAIPNTYDSKA